MSDIGFNPIHCVICNREVPLERFDLDVPLIDELASWNSIFSGIYNLWLDSGAYEQWAALELSNINSGVNERGLSIAKKLNVIHKCYYLYSLREAGVRDEAVRIDKCPICGSKLQRSDEAKVTHDRVCEKCLLIC